MVRWDKLISESRLGLESRPAQEIDDIRSIFQRDYDRIIFSSPFRRLQDKTQVFPLPGSIFVHNRLTHSIEVASVGRSLANIVIAGLKGKMLSNLKTSIGEIGSIVSAACLAHDLGNPPFGHSGESAVADFFKRGNGAKYKMSMSDEEWSDFTCFEGNANALRVLTHKFNGKRPGGFTLTYSTIASFVKYPFESALSEGKQKFGFFQSEKETFRRIATELGMVKVSDEPLHFKRHPLVYLVEAADDICYQIMDIEDAHKLKILTYAETERLFLAFFDNATDGRILENIEVNLNIVTDFNERVAYLRAMVIGKLIKECANIFLENYSKIANGEEIKSLINGLEDPSRSAMNEVKDVSLEKIYNHSSVVEIEIAGYKILGTLLETFISAMLEPDNYMSGKLLSLIPLQYKDNGDTTYNKIQSVVDFVSGMTDLYALDLYQKITGMNLPSLNDMDLIIQKNCTNIDWNLVPIILELGGMGFHEASVHQKAFENSASVVFIFDQSKLVGFGRAISDGAYQSAIYDVAVLPNYQGYGIGRIIIDAIVQSLPGCNFILYASPGKEKFYEKLNFRKLKTGMGLFINVERMLGKGMIE